MKLTHKVKVKNKMGLHIRPATQIVKLLQTSASKVLFTYKKVTVNARSIMSLLLLTARKNTKITISIEGEDAQETLEMLIDAFDMQFGESI